MTHPNLGLFGFVQPSSLRRDQAQLLRPVAAVQRLHLDQGPHQVHHRHHRDQLLLQRIQPIPLMLWIVQLPGFLDLALQLDGSVFQMLEDEEIMFIIHLAQIPRAQVLDPSVESLRTKKQKVTQLVKELVKVMVKVLVIELVKELVKVSTDLEKIGKLPLSESGNLPAAVPASAWHRWTWSR